MASLEPSSHEVIGLASELDLLQLTKRLFSRFGIRVRPVELGSSGLLHLGSLSLVGRSRGLERLVHALSAAPGVHMAMVGHSQSVSDSSLMSIAREGGSADRLHLLPPVPHTEVPSFIASADFGVLPVANDGGSVLVGLAGEDRALSGRA